MTSEHHLYDLFLLAQQGNDDALIQIIEDFKPLIRKVTRTAIYNDRLDLEQLIILRMVKVIKSYDLSSISNAGYTLQPLNHAQ